jgi:hypothetical protein
VDQKVFSRLWAFAGSGQKEEDKKINENGHKLAKIVKSAQNKPK